MSAIPSVPVNEVKKSPAPPVPEVPSQRVTILSELDSYILERQKEQPTSLEEAVARIEVQELRPRHRLEMPESLQRYFMDERTNPSGRFIPRWVFKEKRAVDRALNVGWMFFNRSYFPDAPQYLFTANGGIEVGDAILMFMPVKHALAIREAPGKLSQERIKGQMTQTDAEHVVMTGNLKDPKVYAPELGPEAAEDSEERVPGVLTEGRDF